MYLKRIEIYGFKSFAQKSVLLFDATKSKNITAVVGPNGSGKSNVADAIRWVTGEQSSKNLRSKKSEDVIFCGSSVKPRGSYAEVSIILADEKPVKFELNNKEYELAEIEVSRKLYRSGESEYLINRRKVRLTDVQQLLASLGFGQSSYTVIGQGMVDRLLFFTAAERKVLFDEAAGVKQYEIKREQSLRKLESTDANLIRLKDILTELTPRVANLRRLVKRAEGRKDIESELAEARIRYYGSLQLEYSTELKNTQVQKEVLDKKIVEIEERLTDLKTKVVDSRNNPYREERVRLEDNISSFNSKRDQLREKVAYLKGQIESAERNKQQLNYRKEQLISENERIKASLDSLKENIAKADEALKTSRDGYDSEGKKLSKIEESIKALDEQLSAPAKTSSADKVDQIETKLSSLGDQKQELSGQIYASRQRVSTAAAMSEQNKKEQERVKSELDTIASQYSAYVAKLKEFKEQKTGLEKSVATKEKDLSEVLKMLSLAEKELSDLAKEISDSNLVELTGEISAMTKDYGDISSKFDSVKTVDDLQKVKGEFTDYGKNLQKIFSRVSSVVKSVNPKEREKIERSISEFRGTYNLSSKELQDASYELVKLNSEISSCERRAEDLAEAKKDKENQLKEIQKRTVEGTELTDLPKLESELAEINSEIAVLDNELKKYSNEISERQNAILREKDVLQSTYREQRQKLYNFEMEVSRHENILNGLKSELAKSETRKIDIEREIQDFGSIKDSSDSSISSELLETEKNLSKIEGDIAKERGALIQVSEKERDHREKGSRVEREIRDLGEEKLRLQNQLSTLEVTNARSGVRLEDLEKEMELEGFNIPAGKYEILDQMEKDVLRLKIENIRRKLDNTASVDPETEVEYHELEARSVEMAAQVEDLTKAKEDLTKVVKELDERIKNQFSNVFKDIATEFNRYFMMLFNGGNAKLSLGEDEEGSFGIEISANPPGKKVQSLAALSGGERTLTSLALLFAILSVNPSPFVVLDEVDAALDESNTARFIKILEDLAHKTQFIIISHNRETMKAASSLYGVTMDEGHISKLLSVKLTEALVTAK